MTAKVGIFEREGVFLHITYYLGKDGKVEYGPIRSVDSEYKPVGQDLGPLLHMLAWVGPPRAGNQDKIVFAERILSVVAKELE